MNALDALADASRVKDPANSSNFALSTLHACRQQLAEAGSNPNTWLDQQARARGATEIHFGLWVRFFMWERQLCSSLQREVPVPEDAARVRRQLAEAGSSPAAWLQQQVGARCSVETRLKPG